MTATPRPDGSGAPQPGAPPAGRGAGPPDGPAGPGATPPDQEALALAAGYLAGARTVTVLTGAGISTESGIPDFRGPDGLWTRDPEAARLSNLEDYLGDPGVRRRAWRTRRDHPAWTARPNAGHRALVELEGTGRLHAIVTQNIDRLHQRAGSDPDRIIEIHGSMYEVQCLACGQRGPMSDTLRRVDRGELDPPCLTCGGILKSATVAFGQALDRDTLRRAAGAAAVCDLLVAVGTSLGVYPAAGLVDIAAESGARVVILNATPTPYDRIADAVLRGPIGRVLPALVAGAGTA